MLRKDDIHSAGPYTASFRLCQFSFKDKVYKASEVGFDIFQTFSIEKKGIFASDQ